MKQANVFVNKKMAAIFTECDNGQYRIDYIENYQGLAISLTMPMDQKHYIYDSFPAFFDGLLPEGPQLEALLRISKRLASTA